MTTTTSNSSRRRGEERRGVEVAMAPEKRTKNYYFRQYIGESGIECSGGLMSDRNVLCTRTAGIHFQAICDDDDVDREVKLKFVAHLK